MDFFQVALSQSMSLLNRFKPDKFEIYFEKQKVTKIDSKDQKIDTFTDEEDIGLSIRVIKNKKLGFSFTTSLHPRAIEQAIQNAFQIASYMPEDPYIDFIYYEKYQYPSLNQLDKESLKMPLQAKIEITRQLEASCKQADSRITGVRSASISEINKELHMVDSSGKSIESYATGYTANILCKAETSEDSQMGSEFCFSSYLKDINIVELGQSAAQNAIELLGAKQAPTLHCPAVLKDAAVSELVEFLASSFSAEQIDKGRSILLGRQHNQTLFSKKITLIEDGLYPNAMGSCPFDAEGIPSQRTLLLHEGIFLNTLCNSYYGKKMNLPVTGSSIRSLKSPPTIGFSNLFLQPGKTNSLLDGISKGVFITELMGVHTANPVTGDFSLGASGLMIEKGKLTHPIRGFAIAGNLLDLLSKVTDISGHLKWFGRIGAPSLRLSDLSIGGL